MATLSTVSRESVGSTTLHIFKLTGIRTSDTYATGLTNGTVAYWMTITSGISATAASAGTWQLSESAGTVTFKSSVNGDGAAINATLYTLSYT